MKTKTQIKVSLKNIEIIIHNTNIRRKMLKFKGRIMSKKNAGRVKMMYVLSEVNIINCTFSVHSVLSAVSLNTTAYLSFYTDLYRFSYRSYQTC